MCWSSEKLFIIWFSICVLSLYPIVILLYSCILMHSFKHSLLFVFFFLVFCCFFFSLFWFDFVIGCVVKEWLVS